ncbi:hypothetical protein CHS0354_015871 [Potamilus streckersoni]|uniref:Uncharacterized protein n=1 Tax=Potamilus streckersoni TaxID=2493646 RepID=A0AAE0SDE1_9BIVA|nr:hypothetical protein CHS0354_015871 [Potamilus streckersoni]
MALKEIRHEELTRIDKETNAKLINRARNPKREIKGKNYFSPNIGEITNALNTDILRKNKFFLLSEKESETNQEESSILKDLTGLQALRSSPLPKERTRTMKRKMAQSLSESSSNESEEIGIACRGTQYLWKKRRKGKRKEKIEDKESMESMEYDNNNDSKG